MSRAKHTKQQNKNINERPERAIIKILRDLGKKTQPEIQELIKKEPYKITPAGTSKSKEPLSRQGLWKLLNSLTKKFEINKDERDGKTFYKILPKSKILSEINGDYFRLLLNISMRHNQDVLLKELSTPKKQSVDLVLKYIGFHVVCTIFGGYNIPKKQRPEWLRNALDLDKEQQMSMLFEEVLPTDDELKEFAGLLQKHYKYCTYVINHTSKFTEKIDSIYKENMFK